MRTSEGLPTWLCAVLACPICHGELDAGPQFFFCARCDQSYPLIDGFQQVDFFPRTQFFTDDHTKWSKRHSFFQDWLASQGSGKGILGDEEFFATCVQHAGPIDGEVLDVGGGDGHLCRWLPRSVHYVCIDPEEYKLKRTSPPAIEETAAEPALPPNIRAVGEFLPFRDESFQSVLCLATLNHTSRPDQVLRELGRVVRRGGTLLLSLEEVPALLPMLHFASWRATKTGLACGLAKLKASLHFPNRPSLQPDHITVPRRKVAKWLGKRFKLEETFFCNSRGVVEMGQRWRKADRVSPLPPI